MKKKKELCIDGAPYERGSTEGCYWMKKEKRKPAQTPLSTNIGIRDSLCGMKSRMDIKWECRYTPRKLLGGALLSVRRFV